MSDLPPRRYALARRPLVTPTMGSATIVPRATPGETLTQLKRWVGRVQGPANSGEFLAPGGGGGLAAPAQPLRKRRTEVSRMQGQQLRA